LKNQYFGDVNDYQKYSVLRALSTGTGIRTTVCWALTSDDDRSDGSRVAYLSHPNSWRPREPEVFDILRDAVVRRRTRSVRVLERSRLLENCRYWRREIPTSEAQRRGYFDRLFSFAQGSDLMFFDPDNGLEVKSCPPGGTHSSRYIYWGELQMAWSRGHSILVYQHFPRVARAPFVRRLTEAISSTTAVRCVIAIRTSRVVFLLIPQAGHLERLTRNLGQFMERWSGLVTVEWYRFESARAPQRGEAAVSSGTVPPTGFQVRPAKLSACAPPLATPQPC
jgi:hypothetical protein